MGAEDGRNENGINMTLQTVVASADGADGADDLEAGSSWLCAGETSVPAAKSATANTKMKIRYEGGNRPEFWSPRGVYRNGILGMLAALAMSAAHAQEFSATWFSVDGGGGLSVGGAYAVFDTVGQPDAAAPSSGGGYTLTAGFVPGLSVQSTAPLLSIAAISQGQVTLAWEGMGVDYVLQQAATLDPGGWTDIPAGGISPVVLTALESGKFYRLRRR